MLRGSALTQILPNPPVNWGNHDIWESNECLFGRGGGASRLAPPRLQVARISKAEAGGWLVSETSCVGVKSLGFKRWACQKRQGLKSSHVNKMSMYSNFHVTKKLHLSYTSRKNIFHVTKPSRIINFINKKQTSRIRNFMWPKLHVSWTSWMKNNFPYPKFYATKTIYIQKTSRI